MAIELQEGKIIFPYTEGIKQSVEKTVIFTNKVSSAQATLKGYNINYEGKKDHPLFEMEISLENEIKGNSVIVTGNFGMQSDLKTYAHPYGGWITFVVIADVS